MTIQWFPGHMQKARRQMEEQLKLVDIIIELRDARIPMASENPLLKEMAPNKPRLVILNKCDLSDPLQNQLWSAHLKEQGVSCILTDSLNSRITNVIVNEVKLILKDKLEKAKAKGIRKKVLRAMVVGIPNVGKSTFINNIVKKRVAKAENRPGVTKSLQWIRINEDVELLDTPGVLWPRFERQEDAMLLALLGSINDDVVDKDQLIRFALNYLVKEYPGALLKRYGVDENSETLFEDIARHRNWISEGNVVNLNVANDGLLKEIRSNVIGKITWEKYHGSAQ